MSEETARILLVFYTPFVLIAVPTMIFIAVDFFVAGITGGGKSLTEKVLDDMLNKMKKKCNKLLDKIKK